MNDGNNIYAVIDTNVLVSSLFSSDGLSSPSRVVRAMLNGVIIPLYNEEIIEEYRDVLSRPKFNFSVALIDDLLAGILEAGLKRTRKSVTDEYFTDIDDIVFYEVTMSIDDAYLVTGNIKHFPKKSFVVTPSQMIEILHAKGLL